MMLCVRPHDRKTAHHSLSFSSVCDMKWVPLLQFCVTSGLPFNHFMAPEEINRVCARQGSAESWNPQINIIMTLVSVVVELRSAVVLGSGPRSWEVHNLYCNLSQEGCALGEQNPSSTEHLLPPGCCPSLGD